MGSEMVLDPVCRMKLLVDKAAGRYEYKGKTYYFCAQGCMDRFVKDPEKYLSGEETDYIDG